MRLAKREPAFEQARGTDFSFGGTVGERIAASQRNWLMTAPTSNPAMLQIFRDRERNYTVATAPDGLL